MDCPCVPPGRSNRNCRWFTKWFKRWAFAKGVGYTREHSLNYGTKYLLKFVRKRRKMSQKQGATSRSARVRARARPAARPPARANCCARLGMRACLANLARCAQIRLLDASDDHALASALAHQLVPTGKPKDDRALRVSVAEAIRAHLKKAGVDMDVEARAWVHEYTEYSLGLREVGAHALTFNLRRACVPCACAAGSRVRACACSAMLTYRGMSSMHARPRAHLRTPPARHSLRH